MNDPGLGRDDITEIDAERLVRMLGLHVAFLLFDLRPEKDFESGHVRGAVSVLAADFMKKLPAMVPKKDTPIVIYDEDGVASGDLAALAEKSGFINVVNLLGGFHGFKEHAKTAAPYLVAK